MRGICVVVCTCDRHGPLADLLPALAPQLLQADAWLVITDNGTDAAMHVANVHCNAVDMRYVRLEERGLVAARNAGLAAARETSASFIAFIDDDEVPETHWLQNLHKALETTGGDIACGPCIPDFLTAPPAWAAASHFFVKDGSSIGTGNMMFRTTILPGNMNEWFQPAFAFSGGEDEEFFGRLIAQGARFITAHDAVIRERVPASRLQVGYILRTGLRDGIIETQLARQNARNSLQRASLNVRHAAKKLGYAANHIFWSWKQSWRGIAALRDLAEVLGTIIGAAGFSGRFYGPR